MEKALEEKLALLKTYITVESGNPIANLNDAIRLGVREGIIGRYYTDGKEFIVRWKGSQQPERYLISAATMAIVDRLLEEFQGEEVEPVEAIVTEENDEEKETEMENLFEHPDLSYTWEGESVDDADVLELYRMDNPGVDATDAAILKALKTGVSLVGLASEGKITVNDVK